MKTVADLHIHSRYSQATSSSITIANLEAAAREKGVTLLGTGDFTHPKWIDDIKKFLTDEDDTGVYRTHTNFPFLLTSEISLIYTQANKGRRIHHIVLAPSLRAVDAITEELKKRGRVDYDGRPVFGMTSPEFIDLVMGADERCRVIPAHIWTPWFSLFGSNSGFDSMKDCYGDTLKHIKAIETGMSSDPAMNWRLSQLDDISIVSFSDSHSLYTWRLGREACVFDLNELTYNDVTSAIANKNPKTFSYTIEVNPAYGKYHYDGHRNCGVEFSPKETIAHNGICPKCNKKLTIGVEYRVEQLADRPEGSPHIASMCGAPKGRVPFKSLIPLREVVAAVLNSGIMTKSVDNEYRKIIGKNSELDVLMELPYVELKTRTSEKMANAIMMNREGKVKITPGYDGVYGVPVFEKISAPGQQTL